MGAIVEILDCNDPLLNVKIPKNPFSHVKTAGEIGFEKQLPRNSPDVEFPSLLPLRVCGNQFLPTDVTISNIPEL